MDEGPHRARPTAEDVRDLRLGQVLVEAQHDGGPLSLRQVGERVTATLPTFAALFLTIGVFLALVMTAMVFAGRVFALDGPDRTALFFCGSTKSLASGLPIATAIFPPASVGAIVLPVMLFHISQLLVCAIVSQKLARQQAATA